MMQYDAVSSLPLELVYLIFTMAGGPYPLYTAMELSQVSQRWRSLAIGTHILWTEIGLSFRGPSPWILDIYFARAGPLPCKLYIDFWRQDSIVDDYVGVMRSTFQVVLRYIERIQLLDVASDAKECFEVYTDVFGNAAAPVLKELIIRYVNDDILCGENGVALFAGGAPSLESYLFQGFRIADLTPFPSTKYLYVSDCVRNDRDAFVTRAEMARFLRNHPATEHLAIQCRCMYWGWDEPEPPELVGMEYLRSLAISNPNQEAMDMDFAYLLSLGVDASTLETLTFVEADLMRFVPHLEGPFQVFPNVRTLALIYPVGFMPIDNRYKTLAVDMPSLSHIVFVADEIQLEGAGEALARLLDQNSTSTIPWHGLLTLTLGNVPIENVYRIVQRRETLGHPVSRVRTQLSSLIDEDQSHLLWLRAHVQIEHISTNDIITEYERGLVYLKPFPSS